MIVHHHIPDIQVVQEGDGGHGAEIILMRLELPLQSANVWKLLPSPGPDFRGGSGDDPVNHLCPWPDAAKVAFLQPADLLLDDGNLDGNLPFLAS